MVGVMTAVAKGDGVESDCATDGPAQQGFVAAAGNLEVEGVGMILVPIACEVRVGVGVLGPHIGPSQQVARVA